MRILFWGNCYPRIGGIETFIANLAEAARARGMAVGLLGDGPPHHEVNADGVPVWVVPATAALDAADPLLILQASRAARAALEAFRPDVIHYNTSGAEILLFDRVSRSTAAPVVTTLHNQLGGASAATLARLFGRSCAVTAVSAFVRSGVLACGVPPDGDIALIPNALPPRPRPEGAPRGPHVLALGRMVLEKGFDTLVEAFPRVLRACPQARLTIAGNGPEREPLMRRADALGIGTAVDFPGWIAPDRVHDAMADAAVIAMPSRWQEPFGLVALEAARAGRPCVAAAVGGLPSIVVDGATGRLVQPDRPEDWAAAILAILADPEAARAMGDRALAHALAAFDFDRMVDAYVDAFHRAHGLAG